jgi:molecular chaperone DnaK
MNRKVSNKIIGIDLGTTNSCVAVSQREGVKVISNIQEGKNTTPSVVSFKNGEREEIGTIAKRQATIRPEEVIYEAKRLIGRNFNSPEVQNFSKIAPFKIFEKKEKNGAA